MEQRLKLPVGIDDFEKIRRNEFYYVDKTKLIEQLLQNWGEVSLFTRPRRFGKTLNMSMLKCFFEIGTAPATYVCIICYLPQYFFVKSFPQVQYFQPVFSTIPAVFPVKVTAKKNGKKVSKTLASTVAIAESLEVYVTAAFAGAVFAVNCTGVSLNTSCTHHFYLLQSQMKKASRLTDCISIFYGIGKKCLQEA